jgi:ethylmalonyl-CoA/methylmalonyl-CoA decarboxylase
VLDHPATKNALHPGMMVQLADVPARLGEARIALLRGAGGAFCSGGNLAAVRAWLVRPGSGAALCAFMQAVLAGIEAQGALIVGVVDGPALGGGAELLTACDFVVAGPEARIGFVQARLGVSPGFGGGARLVRRVGAARALHLLTAGPVSGEEACRLGLVDAIAADPLAWARAWARERIALPPRALAAARAVVRAAVDRPFDAALAAERAIFASTWGGSEHLAALDAASRSR